MSFAFECQLFTKNLLKFYFIQSESDSDEEDPLDAYMMGIEQHLEKEKTKSSSETHVVAAPKSNKGVRGDIDDEDDEESYYRWVFKWNYIASWI